MKNKPKKHKKHCPPPVEPPAFPAPSELSIFDAAADRVIVQFKDNSEGEERFQLQRFHGDVIQPGESNLDQTHDVPPSPGIGSMVQFTDTTPEPDSMYTYRVRAHVDGDFVSNWSNLVTTTTPAS